MIEFYTASWVTRIFITFILGIGVLSQTLATVLNFYRHDQTTRRVFENLFEMFIVVEILIFSLLHGEVVNGYKNGILVPVGYENIRIAIFIIILILGIVVGFLNKTILPLGVITATSISLPFMEDVLGSAFPWGFVAILIFFLIRSIKVFVSSLIAIRTSISALSVIQAVNTLRTGVLFCESDGYTVLLNHQMQKLMLLITGQVFRDSLKFYKLLISDKFKSRYEKVQLEGQAVYLLPDGSAWMFTKTEIPLLMKNYIHISAADVSENWSLTSKLQIQDQELRNKSEELKRTISNLHILSKEKEIENAKIRAHDILGQRLTVLLRMIQNEEILDYKLLTSLSKGLIDEIKAEHDEISPLEELQSIQEIFNSIGVDINFKGKLPEDKEQAGLFVDIIREGSANAVRHGFATRINIESEEIKDSYNLVISNVGHTTSDPIIPGSGIKAIRKKVEAQGGNIEITPYPQFTLSVVLPGGGMDV